MAKGRRSDGSIWRQHAQMAAVRLIEQLAKWDHQVSASASRALCRRARDIGERPVSQWRVKRERRTHSKGRHRGTRAQLSNGRYLE